MPRNPNDELWDPHPRIGQPPSPTPPEESSRDDQEQSSREGADAPSEAEDQGRQSVLVEFRAGPGTSPVSVASLARGLSSEGFILDEEFEIVPMSGNGGIYVVRGIVTGEHVVSALQRRDDVVNVWKDTPIAPF
jgi:hypothetical protein